MALSKTTQDHDEIRQWAEKRGAKPAAVASTEKNGQTGILRLEFPGKPHANDSALTEISWEEFFEKFDDMGLEFIYQDVTSEGAESNFNKLVYPENDKSHGSKSSSSSKSHAKSDSGSHAKSASGSHTKSSGTSHAKSSSGHSGSHEKSSSSSSKSHSKKSGSSHSKAA